MFVAVPGTTYTLATCCFERTLHYLRELSDCGGVDIHNYGRNTGVHVHVQFGFIFGMLESECSRYTTFHLSTANITSA